MSTEEAVTPEELAAELRCAKGTVIRMARRGDIPGFRIGQPPVSKDGKPPVDRRPWRFYPTKVREALNPSVDPWAQPARSRRRAA